MSVSINFGSEDGYWAYKAREKIETATTENEILEVTCQMFAEWLKVSVRTLMYSLTGPELKTELRIWTKIPFHFGTRHVESFGNSGGLISVMGDRNEVNEYLNKFLELYSLSPAILPNGVIVYLREG